ncbi:MAG: hypothetical protein M0P13_02075 [Fibrobacteraceae bacterium]|nr:hypothetical protein [Fibrobacteraceae bacterium]
MSEPLEIECPLCHGIITVDRETGKILSHQEKKIRPSFEAFLESQKTRTEDLNKKFEEAKEKEKLRLSNIEKKFEAAKKNKDLKDPPPSIMWD